MAVYRPSMLSITGTMVMDDRNYATDNQRDAADHAWDVSPSDHGVCADEERVRRWEALRARSDD